MNKEELQQQIALYFSKLPKEVQEIFAKMEWLETLKKVSEKYGLKDEQIQTLGTETTLVLLGIIHLDEYENKVKTELGLLKDSAEKMLAEINESVLKNVRTQLSDVFYENAKALEEQQIPIDEKLDERFDRLPEEVRKIISASGYYAKLYAIAEENKLNIPQMGILEETTTGVIVGSIHPEEFEKILIKNLGLPDGVVRKVANEVDEKILKLIRENMERIIGHLKPEISKNETVVLNQAGIKIIHPISQQNNLEVNKPKIDAMELKEGDEKVDQKMIPVLEQKLSGSVRATIVQTDHSMNNLSKTEDINKKVDPYREPPE